MDFTHRLNELMQSTGTTNYRLAKEVGCSPTTVANWRSGKEISQSYLQAAADYFGVSADYLLGTSDQKRPARGGEGPTDEEIKVALFGGGGEVTDAMWEEAKTYIAFIKERERKKKETR